MPAPVRPAAIPPPVPAPRPPRAHAIALSALVYPGVGQFIQGRWLAGGLYAATTTVAAAGFILFAYATLKAYYDIGMDFLHARPDNLPIRPLLACLLISLGIWVLNIADVCLAHAWIRRRAAAPGSGATSAGGRERPPR